MGRVPKGHALGSPIPKARRTAGQVKSAGELYMTSDSHSRLECLRDRDRVQWLPSDPRLARRACGRGSSERRSAQARYQVRIGSAGRGTRPRSGRSSSRFLKSTVAHPIHRRGCAPGPATAALEIDREERDRKSAHVADDPSWTERTVPGSIETPACVPRRSVVIVPGTVRSIQSELSVSSRNASSCSLRSYTRPIAGA